LLPKFAESSSLPRLIHQAYVPAAAISPELGDNIAWIRQANPDWEHRFYGEAEIEAFVQAHYGERVLGYLRRISPEYDVVRVDLFKYLLMYHSGGVYLDAKSRPLRPLSEVLRPDERFILSHWRNGPDEAFAGFGLHRELRRMPRGEFQQWHIVASPGHPFLRAVIERVLRNIDLYNPALHGGGQHAVLRLTGPIPYGLAIAPLTGRHPHRLVDSEEDLGFQYSIFGDSFTHRTRLGSHYSERSEPIVQVGPLMRATAPLVAGARALKRHAALARGAAARIGSDGLRDRV
jgi:hypothetical protein